MCFKKRRRKKNRNYRPNIPVNNLVYGKPQTIGRRGPRRIFLILTGITTTIIGVWTALTLIVNGNINGRYAEYARKDSAVYDLNRSFDEDAKSMEFAIAILDSEFPPDDNGPDDRDNGPAPSGNKEIWTPTRINLSKNLGYDRILGDRGMTEPNVIQNSVEAGSWRYNYKEFSFMNESDLLDFKDGYGYTIDTEESYEITEGFPNMLCDGKNRNKSYASGSENEDLFTYLQINGEYYYAGRTGIFKYVPEDKKFYIHKDYPTFPADNLMRVSAKDGYIYVAYGASVNPSNVTVLKYDINENEFLPPFEISAMGQGIDLYAGFVVDDEERLLFNKVTKVNNTDYEASIVSCTLDGKWEQRSEFGTLISETGIGYLSAFITLEQTDYGIAARSGEGILFYSFEDGSVSIVFEASEAYMFRADGPYIYSVPCPEPQKGNQTAFLSLHYMDWSNFCLKRANVLTGDVQTIDLSSYYGVIDFVPFHNITNTRDATDKPTNRPTCEANADMDQGDLQRKFTMRFVCNMNQNKCVFGYYDDYWKKEGKHFVVAEIDDSGNVTCSSY